LFDLVTAQNVTADEVVIRYTRGAVLKNLMSKSYFMNDLKKMMAIYNVNNYQDLLCYQQIMLDLDKNNLSYDHAIEVITIIENLLMDLVSEELYFIGGYTPYLNNIISGIRYTWVNPFSWMNPFNYYGENNDKVYELLYEMDQLGDIAGKYDSLLAIRLKTLVFSYLHWRKVILGVIFLSCLPKIKEKIL
jgi:hypothetical protein